MRNQPNSILKSPNNPSKTTIPIPPSLQALHSGRRVSFGRDQIHEFTIESTYSQGNSDLPNATANTDETPNQVTQSRVSLGESMELTDIDNINGEHFFTEKKEQQPDTCQSVPTSQPSHLQFTRPPLIEKHFQSNTQLPYQPIDDIFKKRKEPDESLPGDVSDLHSFLKEAECVTPSVKNTNFAQVTMEMTEINKSNAGVDILQAETMQPVHLSPKRIPDESSRMSWLGYSENPLFDKVDESVQTTFNESPVCVLRCKPALDLSITLPTDAKYKEWRYQQYLKYRERMKELRPIVNMRQAKVSELKCKEKNLKEKIAKESILINDLKDKLAIAKAQLREKRDAIQLDVTSRLENLNNKFLDLSKDAHT